MAIAGPRLDSPSAIGDEGRPRAASLWVATLVVVAVVGGIGIRTGESSLLPTLALVAGGAVAGVALTERDSFARLFVGHLLLVTCGSALAVLVIVGPVLDRALFVAAACALSLVGVAATWADIGSDDVARAVKSAAVTYISMLVSAIVVSVLLAVALAGRVALQWVTGSAAPLWSLVGFLAVVWTTAAALLIGYRKLPLRQLTPRSRRERLEARLERVHRGLRWTLFGLPVLGIVLTVLWTWGGLGATVRQFGLGVLFRGLSSPVIVWPLVAVGFGVGLVGLLADVVRRLTRQISVESTRSAVAMTVGVAITVVGVVWAVLLFFGLVRGVPRLAWGLTTSGAPIAALLLAGPLALLVVGVAAVLADGLELLPTRATGPAVAATGLLFVAIGLGGGEPVLTFATVAGALLVWDVSTFGLGLTAELGHLPDTRRLELFHAAVAVGVALGAVLLAAGLEVLRSGAFAGIGTAGGAVVIAFGAVLLLVPLRG
ncbi:hypothetical protein Htur_3551 [Haloterrigena turkmenica DSM 5511]|uniref:Uncharacterized protein n=1 Tax=Haloterrigena turkmenica (strain ATCC 51198 / DSM 5511 / JCM 9101 / NCIMB 13204 / VKM B-1734 / 4k) TaxID=543526 RepID=D2RR17_HALTV|nr:hypothetical protein [Haloterrigena turkmenica]ADB62413.1 hypothetical protein Htur_3551 [Haloterrigena turkmenica DSM 5511]